MLGLFAVYPFLYLCLVYKWTFHPQTPKQARRHCWKTGVQFGFTHPNKVLGRLGTGVYGFPVGERADLEGGLSLVLLAMIDFQKNPSRWMLSDKLYFFSWCKENNVPTPQVYKQKMDGVTDYLVKPVNGTFGDGVRIETEPDFSDPLLLVQERLRNSAAVQKNHRDSRLFVHLPHSDDVYEDEM
jgi:hypothetical protein